MGQKNGRAEVRQLLSCQAEGGEKGNKRTNKTHRRAVSEKEGKKIRYARDKGGEEKNYLSIIFDGHSNTAKL